MTGSSPLAAAFDQQRPRLTALAHRILGSRPDAEDAVQEAWLRLARQDVNAVDSLPAWLTTVVGRICLDMLRARRPLAGGPELIVTDTPEDASVLADSVGLALLVVLDTLSPAERLAFVLHDLFAVPFDEIAGILGKSTDASKMLASRARHKVQGTPPPPAERHRQRALVDAFMAAARGGDFEALLRLLDPDVVLRSHNTRGLTVHHGAPEVAARIRRGAKSTLDARPVLVNGGPGLLAHSANGKLLGLLAFKFTGTRITEILSVSDPAQLAALSVNATLWTIAALLATAFTVAGLNKLLIPQEKLARAPGGAGALDFTPGFIRLLGTLEILGAAGLILPRLLDTAPILTPLAATGLAALMTGATVVVSRRREHLHVLVDLTYLALAVFVAIGRFLG